MALPRRHELRAPLAPDESTAQIVRHAGGDPGAIKKELEQFLSDQLESVPEEAFDVPAASLAVQRAIRRAAAHVQSSGKEQITFSLGTKTPSSRVTEFSIPRSPMNALRCSTVTPGES